MVVEKNEFEARKRQLMKKKRRNRAKRRLIVFTFLFVCAAVIFTVLKAPFFNIKTIICVGQENLTEEQVIQIAGVRTDTNIFSTGVKTMKRRLADNPAIAECNVRRLFPNKIKIWVRESKAALYVETDTRFLHVDEKGQIIKITDKIQEEKPKAAKLLDFIPETELLGEYIFATEDSHAKIILECTGILKNLEMLDNITSLSVADLSDIRLDYQDRLYIMLGSYEQMEYKLTFVKKVISESISEYEKALLDYRGKNLYVGPRENPDEKTESEELENGTENETTPDEVPSQPEPDGGQQSQTE